MLCHCWQCYHCLFNVKLLIPHSLFLRNILAFSFSLSVFPPFLLFIDLLQGVATVVYHSTRCQMRQLSWSYAAGKNITGHSWKTFSGGFKRRLILFFKNIIFQKFLFSLYSYSVLISGFFIVSTICSVSFSARYGKPPYINQTEW